MGRSRQPSNGVVGTGDSTESDGSQNHDKSQNTSRQCTHATKSIDQNQVKKNLNLEDIDNNNFCQECSKQGVPKNGEIFVCLKCGAKACSAEHSEAHHKVSRSDPHTLSLKLSDKSVWCHGCAEDIDVSGNKKLKACIECVRSMHEKHLKRPVTKTSPIEIEPIAEELTVENKLLAIPLLPPKTKTQNSLNGVKGLWNLGNTCYFNSVLQCLAQTPNLIETLREMETNKEVSIVLNNGRTLTGQLEKQDPLCEELALTLSNIKGTGQSFTPQRVVNLLRKRVPQFRGNDQHDSHELLRHLLDSVRCSDLKRYRKILLNELGLNGMDNDKVDAEKQKELKQLDREVTDKIMLVPDQVFRGFLVSRLECQECHHSSECVESFLDLSLPVTSEKPHPPSFRRKGYDRIQEEKGGSQMSKHQLKKERKLERKKNREKYQKFNKRNDVGHGESIPSISEKGESDVEGDDGDVDSEESDKKTEAGGMDECRKEEFLYTDIPIPVEFISRLNKQNSEGSSASSYSQMSRSHLDGTGRPPVLIPLTENGVPDISKVSIYDSSQPKLKIYIRDSETIAKEEPSWLSQVYELPELSENGKASLLNENTTTSSSAATNNMNDSRVEKNEKLEKDEEISSDDKTIVGENSCVGRDDSLESWINNQHVPTSTSEWDEHATPIGPPPPPESHHTSTADNYDLNATSDDEALVSGLFEENSTTDGNSECSVQTCLSQFTGIELMTGSNKVGCETCTDRENKGKKDGKTVYTMSTKQLLVSEAPPVLILHIKRFQVQMSSFRKLSRHVAFPLELDFSPFCKVETVKNSPRKLLYSLYGIVEHSGNFSGGHYVAYVKVDNRWFCISDSYVSEVNISRVLQAQAYLLFYKSS